MALAVGDRVKNPRMRMAYKMWEVEGWDIGFVVEIKDRDVLYRRAPEGLTVLVNFPKATCAEGGGPVVTSWYKESELVKVEEN